MSKRMRLPNGFGQISKLSKKNLRNPWRAMVTVGWNESGKPIRKTVGYYSSYNDAYAALMDHHRGIAPEPEEKKITFDTVYDMWKKDYFRRISKTTQNLYRNAYRYCSVLYNRPIETIKAADIKAVVEANMPPSQHEKVKVMLSLVFDYAVANEYTDKNYVKIADIYLGNLPQERHHFAFTHEEMDTLFSNINDPDVQLVLFYIYTGFRPREGLALTKENIKDGYIVGGMKTKAGKNRIVPIHDRIKNITDKIIPMHLTYDKLKTRFERVVFKYNLNPEHRPHDTRVTFVSRMKEAKADDYAIKKIVGHSLGDITEKIYTDLGVEYLAKELSKMK